MKTEKTILIGKNLKQARENKGLTQLDVMRLRGYESTSTVSSHESGVRTPKTIELYELSKLYGVSMDWLHGEDMNKQEITQEEMEIIKLYRSASNKEKQLAKSALTPEKLDDGVISF